MLGAPLCLLYLLGPDRYGVKDASRMQVQAAITDARAASRGRDTLENGHVSSSAHASTPQAGGPAVNSSSGAAPPLAEGTETALLYVRFRAAAEPGLKGMLWCHKPSAIA